MLHFGGEGGGRFIRRWFFTLLATQHDGCDGTSAEKGLGNVCQVLSSKRNARDGCPMSSKIRADVG